MGVQLWQGLSLGITWETLASRRRQVCTEHMLRGISSSAWSSYELVEVIGIMGTRLKVSVDSLAMRCVLPTLVLDLHSIVPDCIYELVSDTGCRDSARTHRLAHTYGCLACPFSLVCFWA